MNYKSVQEKERAYHAYKSKLELIGIDTSLFFSQNEEVIDLNWGRFAEMIGYPRVLRIPDFVGSLSCDSSLCCMDTLFTYKDEIENVQEMYIPNGVKMDASTCRCLQRLSNIKVISYN